MLTRLASETGGRLTRNTNDLTLGYARAQRDLACTYTLGIYLEAETSAHPQRIAVNVLREGLRALHPNHYQYRSDEARHESRVSAAFFAPEMFQTGNLRAHAFTLQPRSATTWETLIAISFPVRFEEPDETLTIDFGAVLVAGPKVLHAFDRRVSLRSKAGAVLKERRFMFLEPLDISPGAYDLRVVMAEADGKARPDATLVALEVPPVTRKELMLVEPILGRPRDINIVVRGDGPSSRRRDYASAELAAFDIVTAKGSFEPMMVQQADDRDELLARNKACLVGRKQTPETTIERSINEDGSELLQLPSVPLNLDRSGKVLCQNLFEIVPDDAIDPGGYVFEATIEDTPADSAGSESLRFAVEPVEERAAAPESE